MEKYISRTVADQMKPCGETSNFRKTRRTTVTEETVSAIEALLLLEPATDSLALPLFTELMVDVWQDQKRSCKVSAGEVLSLLSVVTENRPGVATPQSKALPVNYHSSYVMNYALSVHQIGTG